MAGSSYVPQVNTNTWPFWTTVNSADEIVTEKFDLVKALSSDKLKELEGILNALKTAVVAFQMPDIDIPFAYIPDSITNSLALLTPYIPTPPDKSELEIPDVDIPSDLDLPAFRGVKPTADITPPNYTFSYDENPYFSELLEQLKTRLLTDLANAGTTIGVEDSFKEAAYAWQRSKIQDEYQQQYDQILAENPGFDLPPGSVIARIDQLNLKYQQQLTDLNNKIAEEEIKLAIENKRWVYERVIQLEQVLMADRAQFQQRMLEAAKATLEAAIRIHESLLKAYEMELDVYKTEMTVYQTEVQTQLAVFNAKIDRAKAILSAATERVKAITTVYTAEADGFKAMAAAVASQTEAEVNLLKARVSQSEIMANIELKKAEIQLQASIQQYNLTFETMRAMATVLAQIVASSLGAVSASASVGNSYSDGRSISKQYSESVNNSLSEDYRIDTSLGSI